MRAGGVVHETEVDGVPTFWVDAPGKAFGCLTFRVGHADETLPRRGVTHLVEHLSLAACDGMPMAYNGAVGPTLTTLVASGSPAEVAEVLTTATRSLAGLPWDRLDTEARILRAEAANRGVGLVGHALATRYGARSYGLAGFPELGVHHLDASSIDAWRREWFTRQNAVLWLAGAPSPELDLSALADGRRRSAPAPVPLAEQPLPCWFGGPSGTLAVVAHLARSPEAYAAWSIAGTRVRKRLRNAEGLSYETNASYDPITADDAHGVLVTDCIPDQADAARDAVLVELNRFASSGPTAEELAEHVERSRRALEDPEQAPGDAQRHAVGALLGEDVEDDPSSLLEGLTTDAIGSALAPALRGAVWVVPDDVGMADRRIHLIINSSDGSPPPGPAVHRPAPVASYHPDRLVLDAEELALCWPDDRFIRARWSEIAAVQRWADGGRTIWGSDGFVITIRPGEWRDQQRVIEAIDRQVAPDLVVAMPTELGPAELDPPEVASPDGSARPDAAAAPDGLWQDVKGVVALLVDVVLGSVAVIAALVAIAGALSPNEGWDTTEVVVMVGVSALIAAVFGSTFWRRRIAPDLARRSQPAPTQQPRSPKRPPAPRSSGPPILGYPRAVAIAVIMVVLGAIAAGLALVSGVEPSTVTRIGILYVAGIIAAARA
jgi:hypothetical protein